MIKRVVGWENALNHSSPNTIYIVDEADKIFVDDAQRLPTRFKAIIAFTATVPQHEQEGEFVQRRLDSLKFNVIQDLGFDLPLNTRLDTVEDYQDFFSQSTSKSKLIFCDEDDLAKI